MTGPGSPTGGVIVMPVPVPVLIVVLVLVRVPVAGVMRHAERE
jgi:hypothetical protein